MKKEDIESLNLEGKMIGFYHVSLTNDIRKPMFSVGRLLKVTNTSLKVPFSISSTTGTCLPITASNFAYPVTFIRIDIFFPCDGAPLTSIFRLCFVQGLQHGIRGDWKIIYPNAYCVVDGGSG